MNWSTFLTAFAVDLAAHADLTGVAISTMPTEPGARGDEGIDFVGVVGQHTYHSMGPAFDDSYDVTCRLWTRTADTDAATGKPSRDRCEAMLEAVMDVCKSSASTIYTGAGQSAARITRYEVTPALGADSAWRMQSEFTVQVLTLNQ